jgi:hypothetical protein
LEWFFSRHHQEFSMLEGIDLDVINEGHEFSVSWMEHRIHLSYTHKDYSLKAMNFAKALEYALCRDGKEVTVRVIKGVVRVLTTEEAAIYHRNGYDADLDNAKKHHIKAKRLDVSGLTYEQQEDHRRAQAIQAVELQAIRRVRRTVRYPR